MLTKCEIFQFYMFCMNFVTSHRIGWISEPTKNKVALFVIIPQTCSVWTILTELHQTY